LTLRRSLQSDTDNYWRKWSAGTRAKRGPAPIPNLPAQPLIDLPGDIWSPVAQLQGRNVGEAQPGGIVHVPVAIRLNSETVVEGIQFKAVVSPVGDAPPVEQAVSFVSNIAPPTYTASRSAGLSYGAEEYAAGWLNLNISDSTTFGFLSVRVPESADAGDCYRVSFKYGSMIVDSGQSGDMETVSACVRVLEPADEQAVFSDEWLATFFSGSNAAITAAHMDADGDGLSNLQEFLAGTNPADARSKLEIRGAASGEGDTLHMDFISAPDKVYVIEGTDNLASGVWQTIETVVGDGSVKQMVKSIPDGVSFYRIRLVD